MFISGLLIGSGVAYLTTRFFRHRHHSTATANSASVSSDTTSITWLQKKRSTVSIIAGTGLVVAGSTLLWSSTGGLSPAMLTNGLVALSQNSTFGPALYLGAWLIRPLVLFPATLITVAGGVLFGSLTGLLYAVIGSNLSALVAYAIGLRLSSDDAKPTPQTGQHDATAEDNGDTLSDHKWGKIQPYVKQMQAKPFTTIFVMRSVFLPYDLVNYGAGALAIGWRPFLSATILASLPATALLVLAGASSQSYITSAAIPYPELIIGTALLASLLIAVYAFKQRKLIQIETSQNAPTASAPLGR